MVSKKRNREGSDGRGACCSMTVIQRVLAVCLLAHVTSDIRRWTVGYYKV